MAKRNVLFIEDEPKHSEFWGKKLSAAGMGCFPARNAVEALQELYTPGYSIIILDLRLPGSGVFPFTDVRRSSTGYLLLERIRKTYRLTDMPVVILSQFVDKYEQPAWAAHDPNLTISGKLTADPGEWVNHVLAAANPQRAVTTAMLPPINENPLVAPYYAHDHRGQPLRLRFTEYEPVEISRLVKRGIIEPDVASKGKAVFSVTPYDEQRSRESLGIYVESFTEEAVPYWADTFFQRVGPDADRPKLGEIRGLGRAMMSRYIRKVLYEEWLKGKVTEQITVPPSVTIRRPQAAGFLTRLGFAKSSNGSFSIDMGAADHLLKSVSIPDSKEDSIRQYQIVVHERTRIIRC